MIGGKVADELLERADRGGVGGDDLMGPLFREGRVVLECPECQRVLIGAPGKGGEVIPYVVDPSYRALLQARAGRITKSLGQGEGYELLEEEKGALVIRVLCGTTGLHDALIRLNDEELGHYAEEGRSFLIRFAEDIRADEARFSSRMI